MFCLGLVLKMLKVIMVVMKIVMMPMVMNFITRTKLIFIDEDDDSDDKAKSKFKGVVYAVAKIALPPLPNNAPFSCVINAKLVLTFFVFIAITKYIIIPNSPVNTHDGSGSPS